MAASEGTVHVCLRRTSPPEVLLVNPDQHDAEKHLEGPVRQDSPASVRLEEDLLLRLELRLMDEASAWEHQPMKDVPGLSLEDAQTRVWRGVTHQVLIGC